MKKTLLVIAVSSVVLLSGCAAVQENQKTTTGAVVGAGVAGVAAKLFGANDKVVALAAVVGGLAGAGIGHYYDEQEKAMRSAAEANASVHAVERPSPEVVQIALDANALFASDSSELTAQSRAEVARVVSGIVEPEKVFLTIDGYTDNDGGASYNLRLAQMRADEVAKQFYSKLKPTQISAVGFGEGFPIASNSTLDGKQANRRVVLSLTAAEGIDINTLLATRTQQRQNLIAAAEKQAQAAQAQKKQEVKTSKKGGTKAQVNTKMEIAVAQTPVLSKNPNPFEIVLAKN